MGRRRKIEKKKLAESDIQVGNRLECQVSHCVREVEKYSSNAWLAEKWWNIT